MPDSRDPSLNPLERVDCAETPLPHPDQADPQLERFYLEYFLPLVRRVNRRHGLALPDAHDVVQDAFILAITKLDSTKNPRAWLYQVVDHLSANFVRKTVRRSQLMQRWGRSDCSPVRTLRKGSAEDV